tara:strand:+ start:113 stop:469 length:357 start_codon:yes stop_codon:yes gene_type:complete
MGQETVNIVNIKRSTTDKVVEQTIYKSLWLNKEAKLRADGWFVKDEIKEVITEVVEDGKEIDTIEVVEEVKEELEDVVSDELSYEDMSLEQLKKACDDKDIIYHHASKSKKLISLLTA